MNQYMLQHKNIKYYLLILVVLWSGALVNKTMQSFPIEEVSVDTVSKEESTILFTKSYEGKLTIKEREKIANKVLTNYDAKVVNAIKTKELFTIYAYSNKYDTCITIEEQTINLNLVCYYNEITNETTIILATPIYNEDY